MPSLGDIVFMYYINIALEKMSKMSNVPTLRVICTGIMQGSTHVQMKASRFLLKHVLTELIGLPKCSSAILSYSEANSVIQLKATAYCNILFLCS